MDAIICRRCGNSFPDVVALQLHEYDGCSEPSSREMEVPDSMGEHAGSTKPTHPSDSPSKRRSSRTSVKTEKLSQWEGNKNKVKKRKNSVSKDKNKSTGIVESTNSDGDLILF